MKKNPNPKWNGKDRAKTERHLRKLQRHGESAPNCWHSCCFALFLFDEWKGSFCLLPQIMSAMHWFFFLSLFSLLKIQSFVRGRTVINGKMSLLREAKMLHQAETMHLVSFTSPWTGLERWASSGEVQPRSLMKRKKKSAKFSMNVFKIFMSYFMLLIFVQLSVFTLKL